LILARTFDSPCWSAAVLDEFADVLRRPKIAKRVSGNRRAEMTSLPP